LIQYLEGKDNEDHLAAVVWNAMALLYFEEKED
jgi:anthranilate phosphoribosyltransferase